MVCVHGAGGGGAWGQVCVCVVPHISTIFPLTTGPSMDCNNNNKILAAPHEAYLQTQLHVALYFFIQHIHSEGVPM